VNDGLNKEKALSNMTGSVSPGSFFTVRVTDPADASAEIDTAFGWRPRSVGSEGSLFCAFSSRSRINSRRPECSRIVHSQSSRSSIRIHIL
jgi:hypothetical protein